MSRSSDGKLFYTVGPETEKVRLSSFVLVLTVTADLVVDDLSWLLIWQVTPVALRWSFINICMILFLT